MSRVATYSTLYPFMVPELPGCDTPVILQALQKAGRAFCLKSNAWREDVFPLAIVDYQRDYSVPNPVTGARLHRIISMAINGGRQDERIFETYKEDIIRFRPEYIPYNLDDSLLICGECPSAIAVWQLVTAGSVTITVDSGSYLLSAMNFASCADLDAVALKIQTALRAAIAGNTGFCQWSGTRFGIWTETGTVSYITAGTVGTDISGATYLNGLTGTGALSPRLDLRVVYRPDLTTDVLPDWLLDRHAEAVIAHAMAELMRMHKKKWANAQRAAEYQSSYNRMLNTAIVDDLNDYKNSNYEVKA